MGDIWSPQYKIPSPCFKGRKEPNVEGGVFFWEEKEKDGEKDKKEKRKKRRTKKNSWENKGEREEPEKRRGRVSAKKTWCQSLGDSATTPLIR